MALRAVTDHGPAVAGGIDLDLPGDGVRLRATRWPGRGTPVVLLHGLASTRRFWNLVVEQPALRDCYLLALDARGHGESDQPAAPYDVKAVAADVTTALDALALSRAVVVGHSWGGAVAMTFAAEHPERALAVVAIDGGFTPAVAAPDRPAMRERLAPPGIAVAPEDLAGMLRRGPLAAYWDEARERAVTSLFAVGEDGLARPRLPLDLHLRVLDGLLEYDSDTTFARLGCPVWAVSCEDARPDPAAQEWQARKHVGLETLRRVVERPRVMRWAGALHDVPLQWPAAVAGLVKAAADEVDGAAEPTTGGRGREVGT